MYFRLLLIGFFEGIASERGIAWRVAGGLSLRRFLGYGLNEATPDQVTISRTRRLLNEAPHQAVFTLVLTETAGRGLLKGKIHRHRCHDLRSQRGDALDSAARYRRKLYGISAAVGAGRGRRGP